MIIIKNKYLIKPGMREEFIKQIKENKIQEGFQAQPGCIAFDINIPLDDDNNLGLIDIWTSRETFEAHLVCDVNDRWSPIKDKYLEGTEWTLYEGEQNNSYAVEATRIMAEKKAALEG